MNPVVTINQPVDVIVSFHRQNNLTKALPVRMSYRGQDITFTNLGLRHTVRHGSRLCYVFDMTDSTNDYSLEFDTSTLRWTLLSVIDGGSL